MDGVASGYHKKTALSGREGRDLPPPDHWIDFILYLLVNEVNNPCDDYELMCHPKLVIPKRILVVGPTGAGKTTVSGRLAKVYGLKHVELDALYWGPDWSVRLDFEEEASRAVQGGTWVIDGGYTRVTKVTWPRAELVVWLDYTFPAVFMQLLSRTFRRCWNKENLFGGNRESWRTQFLSKESLFVWLFKTYGRRKRTLGGLAEKHPDVTLLRYDSRKQTNVWLESLCTRAKR